MEEKIENSKLNKYLKENGSSHLFEALLRSRLHYDLRLAAACKGYDLQMYCPDIDHDGYDIILDDKESSIRVQLKSTHGEPDSRKWSVHRRHILPTYKSVEKLGLIPGEVSEGREGGILWTISEVLESEIKVSYAYCDIAILAAFNYGFIKKVSDKNASKVGKGTWKRLCTRNEEKEFTISKNVFLKAESPECLLSLIGLSSRYESWQHHLYTAIELFNKTPDYVETANTHISQMLKKLNNLTSEDLVKGEGWGGGDSNRNL